MFRGDPPDLFETNSMQLSNRPRDLHDERWLVALASVRHRREKRTVRLNQDTFKWDGPRPTSPLVYRYGMDPPQKARLGLCGG